MKILVMMLTLFTVGPAFAKSLDQARLLATKIEVFLPEGQKLLCADCDDAWTEGGPAVHHLEQILTALAQDLRLYNVDNYEQLGPLFAEHIALVLRTTSETHVSVQDGKNSLCGLSKEPCELFRHEIFAKYCTPGGEI